MGNAYSPEAAQTHDENVRHHAAGGAWRGGSRLGSVTGFAANEMAWRVEKATRLGELAQAEHNRRTAETFRHYPTEPGAEWATTHLETDINRTAEIEVIDAKQRLLSLYKDRGRTLSTEEATQAARWEQDRAAWNAREAASVPSLTIAPPLLATLPAGPRRGATGAPAPAQRPGGSQCMSGRPLADGSLGDTSLPPLAVPGAIRQLACKREDARLYDTAGTIYAYRPIRTFAA